MRRTAVTRWFKASLSCLLLILVATAAQADPILVPYTVTDLGNDVNWAISTNASGTSVLTVNGQTVSPYAQPLSGTPISASNLASLPVPEPAPAVYGSNIPNSSSAMNATLLPNGTALAIDAVIQNNGTESQTYIPYYVQQNSNGTWGQPVALGTGYGHFGPDIGGPPGVGYWFDKSGDVLVGTLNPQNFLQTNYNIYNININTYTDLSTLPALVNNGFSNFRVLSMDADGRILMLAGHQTGSNTFESDDLVLLTPAGLSSDPIPTNTPEPNSLVVMALAVAAFVANRARRRRV